MQNADEIYNIHRKISDNNILLAYTGNFSTKVINALVLSVKLKLKETEKLLQLQKKVYSVIAECLETILRGYNFTLTPTKNVNPRAIFTLSVHNDCYHISCGKYIFAENTEFYTKQIDTINAQNRDGKKQLYREYITSASMDVYNTDLAMVDIAIKSNNILTYEFKDVDEFTSFFILNVTVKAI
jgi:hypothetical protein